MHPRLKAHRGAQLPNRPSPRALHLDPEFVNTPGSAVANQTLEQSLETLLEREDKTANSDSEAGLTPVRAVPLTPGQLHTEVRRMNTLWTSVNTGKTLMTQDIYCVLTAACVIFIPLPLQTLVPAGYLIPISQQSLIGYKEISGLGKESNKASTPTYNIYQTPTAGTYVDKCDKTLI